MNYNPYYHPYFTERSLTPTYVLLTITDVQPYLNKWGIFTVDGQKVVAFVDKLNVGANSINVFYPNNTQGVIDVNKISMAEGPFPTMPSIPSTTGTTSGPTSGPTTGMGTIPPPPPPRCQWYYYGPPIGWKYVCF
ncbi:MULTISPECIES: hypothetical protein [unclassified Paenibacillus]|uniref:hypothetical protein n=1 Tax=unclassified Paenibacillus TaxID=185978 RepID=UPI00115FF848|nr:MULTISPECIES: hypothetical protein [unclassified Paenibacillus]